MRGKLDGGVSMISITYLDWSSGIFLSSSETLNKHEKYSSYYPASFLVALGRFSNIFFYRTPLVLRVTFLYLVASPIPGPLVLYIGSWCTGFFSRWWFSSPYSYTYLIESPLRVLSVLIGWISTVICPWDCWCPDGDSNRLQYVIDHDCSQE